MHSKASTNRVTILVYLFLLFLLVSCNVTCDHTNDRDNYSSENCDSLVSAMRLKADHSTNKPLYIVLCDFTSSMDSQGVQFVIQNALKIFDFYYNKATLKFYLVSSQVRSAFFTSEMTQITDSGIVEESEYTHFGRCLTALEQEQHKLLEDTLIALSQNRSSSSYIIRSLENTVGILNLYDPQQKNLNRIFILSDMLESGSSIFGHLNLENKSYTGNISKVEEMHQYPASQKFANNLNIVICVNSKNIQDIILLNKFWNLVLNKMGYQTPITLTSELLLRP